MKNFFLSSVAFAILILLISCGDDNEDEKDILLSYRGGTGSSELFVLTDQEGNFIDSVDVFELESYDFLADPQIERYTLTRIIFSETTTSGLSVFSQYDINTSLIEIDPFSSGPQFDLANLVLDPSIDDVIVSTPVNTRFGSVSNIENTNLEYLPGNFIYAGISDPVTPKYAIYDNVTPGDLNINRSDFIDMEFHPIEFASEITFFRPLILVGNNQDPLSTELNYLADFDGIINGPNQFNNGITDGIFYPGDFFSFYTSIFEYGLPAGDGTSIRGIDTYYSSLPSSITPLEVDFQVEEDFMNYSVEASGDFDLVSTQWVNAGATDFFVNWIIEGTQGSNYPKQAIISIINSKYPQFDLSGLQHGATTFSDYSDQSYDNVINEGIDARTPQTVTRSLRVQFF